DESAEGCFIIDGHFGEDLAIYSDVGSVDGMHQLAVGHAMHACSGVDACDPQAAHITLAVAAVWVHGRPRAHDRFMGWTEEAFTCTTMAFSHLQDFFVSLMSGNSAFYPWHSPCISSVLSSDV